MKTIGLISANYVSGNFGDITVNRTMASIPFGGRYRLVDFALSNMVNAGITTVGVITPFNSGSLIDHVGVGKPWSLDRKTGGIFLMPGSVYGLRTPGNRFIFRDIINNMAFLERDDADYVIFSSGSDVYNTDLRELINAHEASGKKMTLAYKKVNDAENYRGFFLDIDENGKVEGMATHRDGDQNYFIDLFIADREYMLNFIQWFGALGHLDVLDIVLENLDRLDVNTFEYTGYYGNITHINDYLKVSKDILNSEIRNEVFNPERPVYTKVQDEAPAKFTDTSNVKNSLVAAGCIIEGTVENSVIFRTTHVAKGAVVKDCVLMMHNEIGENAKIENVISDKFATVNPGTVLVGGDAKPLIIGKNNKA